MSDPNAPLAAWQILLISAGFGLFFAWTWLWRRGRPYRRLWAEFFDDPEARFALMWPAFLAFGIWFFLAGLWRAVR